jgi:hypothetical protein
MPENVPGQNGQPPEYRETVTQTEVVTPDRRDYRGANLRGNSLSGMTLEHFDFRGADLQGVNFSGSRLRYSDFRGAELQGAIFKGASLYGAKMQGAELFGVDFQHTDLRQTDLRGAYLEGALYPAPSPGDLAVGVRTLEKSWDERYEGERKAATEGGNADTDQNQRNRERSLPAEQRQQRKQGLSR